MMPKIYKGILNMAFNSIFVGNNVKVEIATAPTGGGQATTFTVVEEVGAFPSAAGAESNVVIRSYQTWVAYGDRSRSTSSSSRCVHCPYYQKYSYPGASP